MPEQGTYDIYANQFKASYELALQQKASKFDPYITTLPPISGKGGTIINHLQPFEAQVGGDDLGDTEWSIPEWTARWAYPIKIRAAVPITTDDQLYTLEDPQNTLVQAVYAAHRRAMDKKIIIPSMFRTVVGGADQDKSFPFLAAHEVAKSVGGANTGMNWHKYVAVNQIFRENEVEIDEEDITIAIDPLQEAYILHMVEAKNEDFRRLGVMIQDGKLLKFGRWNITISNHLEKSADGQTIYCPVWARSGVGLVTWLNPMVDIGPRRDKNMTVQVFSELRAGAARLEEGKVIRLACHIGTPG